MSNTKELIVKRGQLQLKEGHAYESSTGDIYAVEDVEKVRLESIVKYLEEKTETEYTIHYGEERIYETYNGEECVMLIPANYKVVKCGATTIEDSDAYNYYAIDKDGYDVYDEIHMVFLWSFDLDVDNDGYFIHREGVKNGVLCMNMLEKAYGYTDSEIAEIQSY